MPVGLCPQPCPVGEACPTNSLEVGQLMVLVFDEPKRYPATA